MKRLRTPKAKDGGVACQVREKYGDGDLFYCYPDNECGMKRDSRLLSVLLSAPGDFPGRRQDAPAGNLRPEGTTLRR